MVVVVHDDGNGEKLDTREDVVGATITSPPEEEPCHGGSSSALPSLSVTVSSNADIEHVIDNKERSREEEEDDGNDAVRNTSHQPTQPVSSTHSPSSPIPPPPPPEIIPTEDHKIEENIGYDEEQEGLVVEKEEKQNQRPISRIEEELTATSSEDDDDMPIFSRLRRVVATDLPPYQNGSLQPSFDTDRRRNFVSSTSCMDVIVPPSLKTVEKEIVPSVETEGRTLIQSSRMINHGVNSPADTQQSQNKNDNNVGNAESEKQMAEGTATDIEIAESKTEEEVHFEDIPKLPDESAGTSASSFNMTKNNVEHHMVVVREQQRFEGNEQVVEAETRDGRESEDNVAAVLPNADGKEEMVVKDFMGTESKQFGVEGNNDNESYHHCSSSYDGCGDKAQQEGQTILPTTITTRSNDNADSDIIRDFRPEIDVDMDFFSSGNDEERDENGGYGEELKPPAVVNTPPPLSPLEERLLNSPTESYAGGATTVTEPVNNELESSRQHSNKDNEDEEKSKDDDVLEVSAQDRKPLEKFPNCLQETSKPVNVELGNQHFEEEENDSTEDTTRHLDEQLRKNNGEAVAAAAEPVSE